MLDGRGWDRDDICQIFKFEMDIGELIGKQAVVCILEERARNLMVPVAVSIWLSNVSSQPVASLVRSAAS
jgi:hypothetical protein